MLIALSVVIPAYNAASHLKRCLNAVFAGSEAPSEVIVIDDGSSDNTREIAAAFPVTVLCTEGRRGPAFARNLGAQAARGEVVLFLDSDVCARRDVIERIRERFENDPGLHALMGSYDSTPGCPEFLSQYRNLLHAYVHQTGTERASTFWSGCGAIRREVFLQHSGFSEKFGRPAIEDIELGYRLTRAGCRIELDRDIQVTHLKRWTFWGLVKTDIFDRGIPWTELILRDRFMPNDLNLHLSQRVSVALVFILVALSFAVAISGDGYPLIPLFAIGFVLLARWWVEFATPHRPRTVSAVLITTVGLIAFLAWRHQMYGIIAPLTLSPALLFHRHRYAYSGRWPKLLRWLAISYTCCSLGAAALYLPANPLIFICCGILALLGLMNSQFYLFLAGTRGVPFMLAAIPFHLLYHFYNGLSFIAGTVRYYSSNPGERIRSSAPPAPTQQPSR